MKFKMSNVKGFLNRLNGSTLKYAVKSPNLDLYDFCFHHPILEERIFIHVTCRFKIINMTPQQSIKYFDEDTIPEVFSDVIEKMYDMKITRTALSSKNDLWIDFGCCRIVFVTFEDDEESWRIFSSNENVHLVANSRNIEYC